MKPLLLTLNLLCGADAATTTVALNHGAREIVIPSQSPIVIDAVVVGEAVLMDRQLMRLSQSHPTRAKVLAIIAIGFRGAIVVNNIHQLRRQQ